MTNGRSNRPPDLSLIQNGVWERASFTVPDSVSEERVQFHADKYQRKFGDHLEGVGFTVVAMTEPEIDTGSLPVDPDRRRYIIWAWVRRRPIIAHMEVEDEAVPTLLKLGMSLA